MSRNQDTFEMLDSTPVKPARRKLAALAIIAMILAIGALVYFFAPRQKPIEVSAGGTPNTPAATPGTPAASPGTPAATPSAQPPPSGVAASAESTETLHFNFNQASVLSEDSARLRALCSRIKDGKGTIIIEGFTDDLGSDHYNQQLSRMRAEAVAQELKNFGLKRDYELSLLAKGESEPVAGNDTEKGRAANRRAVISVNRVKAP